MPNIRQLHFVTCILICSQLTILSQLSGTRARNIGVGIFLPLIFFQTMVSSFQIIAWNSALLICHCVASLVDGRAFRNGYLENKIARAPIQLPSSVTLHIKLAADFTVESSTSLFLARFLSSMWCSVNMFHGVF